MSAPTVLIVDDQESARNPIRIHLQRLGCRVLEADSEGGGWDEFEQHQHSIDLMVTDLLMGDQEAGSRLIERVRNSGSSCPIGVYSAIANIEDWKQKAALPEIVFYLPKEAETPALMRQIQAALGDRRLAIESVGAWEPLPLEEQIAPDAADEAWTLKEEPTVTPDGRVRAVAAFRSGPLELRSVQTDFGSFHELCARGTRPTGTPGEPALLVSTQRIALPAAATFLQARLENPEWVEVPGCYRLLPCPAPQIEGQPPAYMQSMAGYGDRCLPFSSVGVSPQTTDVDGFPCVVVSVIPIRHNSRSGRLEILESGEVVVEGEQELLVDATGPRPDETSPLRRQILGWKGSSDGATSGEVTTDGPTASRREAGRRRPPAGTGEGSRRRYLAVGTAEALAAVEPLLELRSRDLTVERVILGREIEIDEQAPPEVRRSAIQRYLRRQSADPSRRPWYVLLVGDHGSIPFYYYDAYEKEIDQTKDIPILSDLWYASFDRSRPESPPRFALGRIPFNDPARLEEYCRRHLDPERDRRWRKWMFVAGEGYGDLLSQQLEMHSGSAHLTDHIFRADDGEPSGWPKNLECFQDDLHTCPSLVTFRGHGLRTQWVLWGGLSSHRLENGLCPPHPLEGVFSIACCTGSLDQPGLDCGGCECTEECGALNPFGRTWLALGAAPWFLASTRKSFTLANNDLSGYLLEAVTGGAEDIGTAHRLALSKLLEGIEATELYRADTAAMSVLLGDPAWPIPKPTASDPVGTHEG